MAEPVKCDIKLELADSNAESYEWEEIAACSWRDVKKKDFKCLRDSKSQPEDLKQLYASHEVKDELVLGPEMLQRYQSCASAAVSIRENKSDGATPSQHNTRTESCSEALPNDSRSFSSPLHIGEQYKDEREIKPRACTGTAELGSGLRGQELACAPEKITLNAMQNNKDSQDKYRCQKLYCCDACGKAFSRKREMRAHWQSHTDGQPSSCFVTDKPFSLHGALRPYTEKNLHCCEICYKTFFHKNQLQRHTRLHTGEKPYSCDVCNKTFSHRRSLQNHDRLHTGEKAYTCDICNKKFTQSRHLQWHKLRHTGEKSYSCDICNKNFFDRRSLQTHIRRHTGEKPYSCDLCNKTFSDHSNLYVHKRIHTEEKPFKCDSCNKTFTQSSHLRRHTRFHTGAKPYSCDVCNKTFSNRSTLQTHKRRHTGEKPYSCDTCNKTFSHSSNLLRHKRIHIGEKPYTCDVCNKKFTQKYSLRIHKRLHTGEKP